MAIDDLPADLAPLTLPPLSYLQCEHVENLQWYGPQKLHPTHFGDRLNNNRFTVVAKLDHQNHSTSWLCRDTARHQWRRIDNIHASNDIKRAKVRAFRESMDERYAVRGRLTSEALQADADTAGLPIEMFAERGPNGEHVCVVFSLNGCWNSFRCEIWDKTLMDERWFVRECAKLREGVAPESVHVITEEEMVRILGRPQIIEVTDKLWERVVITDGIQRDQVPRYLVLRPERIEEDFEFWLSAKAFDG